MSDHLSLQKNNSKAMKSILFSWTIALVFLLVTSGKAQTFHPVLELNELAFQIHESTTKAQPVIAILPKSTVSVVYVGMVKEQEEKLKKFIKEQTSLTNVFTFSRVSESLSKALLTAPNRGITSITNASLVEQIVAANDIDENQIFLYDQQRLNRLGRLLQANYFVFLTTSFEISGVRETKVLLNGRGGGKKFITHFSVTATYQVELFDAERGVKQSHFVQKRHYDFGPENCIIDFDINPNGRYQIPPHPSNPYPSTPIYSNGIEVSGFWSGNNLSGRVLLLEIRAFERETGRIVNASSLPLDNAPLIQEFTFGAYLQSSQRESFTTYLPIGPFRKVARQKFKDESPLVSKSDFSVDFDIAISLFELDMYGSKRKILEERRSVSMTLLKEIIIIR